MKVKGNLFSTGRIVFGFSIQEWGKGFIVSLNIWKKGYQIEFKFNPDKPKE